MFLSLFCSTALFRRWRLMLVNEDRSSQAGSPKLPPRENYVSVTFAVCTCMLRLRSLREVTCLWTYYYFLLSLTYTLRFKPNFKHTTSCTHTTKSNPKSDTHYEPDPRTTDPSMDHPQNNIKNKDFTYYFSNASLL